MQVGGRAGVDEMGGECSSRISFSSPDFLEIQKPRLVA